MLTIATPDNPTALPANDPTRTRQRDTYSWSGIRIAWSLEQRRAYLKMLKRLKARKLITGTLEGILRDLTNRQSGTDPDYCPAVLELAEEQGCSDRTVQRHLRIAESLNILETRPRHRLGCSKRATRKTTQTTSCYVLLLPTEDDIGAVTEPEIEHPVEKPLAGVTGCHPTTDSFYLRASSCGTRELTPAAVLRAERRWRMSGVAGNISGLYTRSSFDSVGRTVPLRGVWEAPFANNLLQTGQQVRSSGDQMPIGPRGFFAD